jgi:hypothetical protein
MVWKICSSVQPISRSACASASVIDGKLCLTLPANRNSAFLFAGGSNYDVTGDGKKFVVASLASSQGSEPLTVVVNWTALPKQK